MPGPVARDPAERFWEKVDRSGDCWLWTAARDAQGYGMFSTSRTTMDRAHRYAWLLHTGASAPSGLDHRPTCPKHCCNPAHLRVATDEQQQQNRRGANRNSITGLRGVSVTLSGKWTARVQHQRRVHYLGTFDSPEDAAAAALAKRLELFTHNDADRVVVTVVTHAHETDG